MSSMVVEFSFGIGAFVIGPSQISFFLFKVAYQSFGSPFLYFNNSPVVNADEPHLPEGTRNQVK